MAQQVSEEKLGSAILQSIEHGAFPQEEDVASATVPSSALPKLRELLLKAKEDTKVTHTFGAVELTGLTLS